MTCRLISKAFMDQNCIEALNQHVNRWIRKLPSRVSPDSIDPLGHHYYYFLSQPAQSRRQEN